MASYAELGDALAREIAGTVALRAPDEGRFRVRVHDPARFGDSVTVELEHVGIGHSREIERVRELRDRARLPETHESHQPRERSTGSTTSRRYSRAGVNRLQSGSGASNSLDPRWLTEQTFGATRPIGTACAAVGLLVSLIVSDPVSEAPSRSSGAAFRFSPRSRFRPENVAKCDYPQGFPACPPSDRLSRSTARHRA